MNAIQNFAFEEHLVRVVDRDGEPWFIAADVCKALDLKGDAGQHTRNLDEDEVLTLTTSDTPLPNSQGQATHGGARQYIGISEPGVYRLVFRSRKPEAERFKRWLAHDVLPAIRKSGSYGASVPAQMDAPAPEDSESRALRMVTEARLIFGKAAAARLWPLVGLPAIPPAIADNEPEQCLQHLLDADTGNGGSISQLLALAFAGVEGAEEELAACGVRTAEGAFTIANAHPFIRKLYRPTRWQQPYRYLRRLDGAMEAKVMKYGKGFTSRGVELPAFYADDETFH